LIWGHESAIPATAGLLVTIAVTDAYAFWLKSITSKFVCIFVTILLLNNWFRLLAIAKYLLAKNGKHFFWTLLTLSTFQALSAMNSYVSQKMPPALPRNKRDNVFV